MKNKDNQTPPTETVVVNPEVVEATAENGNGSSVLTITTANQRNVTTIFEKLQQGQKLHDNYQKAKNRLTEIEDFKSEFDGSALEMVIRNKHGKEVAFASQEPICKFIETQIEHGKEVIGFLEAKVVEFSI